VFVPREDAQEEDDGYLLTITFTYSSSSSNDDATGGASELRVYDAKTMDSKPVVVVPLPRRVPYGFHAIFVPQQQLHHQKSHPTSAADSTTTTTSGTCDVSAEL